ncbi:MULTISPECIES: hypothetical protein [Cupriavidus]|jgi:hypothetical protein|uniref:hypothetical protein n=1 Tax=Cupriavidus TaxID=106589 RepID=UPI000465D780|nr:hypothetical protein [Cupriavidus metallidurans]KWW32339.1 hypothetical protein AU374_05939 [Cupriavidus metallidurans]
MTDLVSRAELLRSAIYCGGIYALWRVLLTVLFPFFSGSLWQNAIGPFLVQRWPTLGQSEDQFRPSYLPTALGQPYVASFGLFPPPLNDLTHGIRDGLLLGVFYALVPEIIQPSFLTLLLAFVVCKGLWRVTSATGAGATDRAIWAIREALMYFGAIAALQAAELLR